MHHLLLQSSPIVRLSLCLLIVPRDTLDSVFPFFLLHIRSAAETSFPASWSHCWCHVTTTFHSHDLTAHSLAGVPTCQAVSHTEVGAQSTLTALSWTFPVDSTKSSSYSLTRCSIPFYSGPGMSFFPFHLHLLGGEGMATQSRILAWRISDRGAWPAISAWDHRALTSTAGLSPLHLLDTCTALLVD